MTSPAPSRHIALPGTTNFRDLGGYRGHQGRSVRWRVLFRSDHLADLTPEGVQALHGLGVRRSADFRGAQERRVDAYAWDGLHTHALTVEPTVVQKAFALIHAGGSLTAADSVALMQEAYPPLCARQHGAVCTAVSTVAGRPRCPRCSTARRAKTAEAGPPP